MPPIYPKCANIKHGTEAPVPYKVIPRDSGWIGGGHTPAQGCETARANWTKENRNPLLSAKVLRYVNESSKKDFGFPRYLYRCELQIYKSQKAVARTANCGQPIGYKSCELEIASRCKDERFATKYTEERNKSCSVEDQPMAFKGELTQLEQNPAVAEVVDCMTCDSLNTENTQKEYVSCIYNNYLYYNYDLPIASKDDQDIFLQSIQTILDSESLKQYLSKREQIMLRGAIAEEQ